MGTFPALNCRTSEAFFAWLTEIAGRLAEWLEAAPFGVVVNRSNKQGRIV